MLMGDGDELLVRLEAGDAKVVCVCGAVGSDCEIAEGEPVGTGNITEVEGGLGVGFRETQDASARVGFDSVIRRGFDDRCGSATPPGVAEVSRDPVRGDPV